MPKNPAFLQLESEILGLLTDKAPVDFPQRQQIFAEGVLLACLVHDHTPSPEIAEVWFKLLLDTDPDCRLMAVRAAETVLRAAKLPMPNVTKERKQGTSYPPALRPDNDEFQYKRMSPEELKVYYDKPYSVKPHQGFRAWSKPAKLRLRAGLKTDGMESEDSDLLAVHQYVKKVAEAFFKVRGKLYRAVLNFSNGGSCYFRTRRRSANSPPYQWQTLSRITRPKNPSPTSTPVELLSWELF